MKKPVCLILGCLILSIASVGIVRESRAGMVIEQTMKDRDGTTSKLVIYSSGDRLRTDLQESGLTTVLDFKDDRLMMIDHRSKSYVDVKFSQWEKEVSKQMKKEMPGTPPPARKITVKKTGETATINGFRTEKVSISADGELIEENWVTRDVDLKEMEKVMERASQGFGKEFQQGMQEGKEIYEKLKPYGFPILIKDFAMTSGLGAIDRVEVKKIEKRDLKDDVFLPPPGYQRIVPESPKK
jgi:hypothetical protein